MRPKWPKLASLAQKICTLWFQFFEAFFASKGYPFKNIFMFQCNEHVKMNKFSCSLACTRVWMGRGSGIHYSLKI